MTTEAEARGLVCPFRMFVYLDRCCIVSECMLWVAMEEPEGWKRAREAQLPIEQPENHGRCGLVNP